MDMALSLPTSNSSINSLFPQTQYHSPFKAFNFGANCCYYRSVQVNATKTKRKPRPSFHEQIRDKWSLKVPSTRDKFPWQESNQQNLPEEDEEEIKTHELHGNVLSKPEKDGSPIVSGGDDTVSVSSPNYVNKAPWMHGKIPKRISISSQTVVGEIVDDAVDADSVQRVVKEVDFDEEFKGSKGGVGDGDGDGAGAGAGVSVQLDKDKEIVRTKWSDNSLVINEKKFSSAGLPWQKQRNVESVEGDWRRKRSNTELAERILAEHELKRLRNVALRMFERIKVGKAGITQDLVDEIHEKWRLNEVVKLKFEDALSCNMTRTHEMLESRTGGLIIWRSGSSVVLYRGISYNLQCVQSFPKKNKAGKDAGLHPEAFTSNSPHNQGVKHFNGTTESYLPNQAKYLEDLSQEESTDFTELDQLLNELGPRFNDWCGREPLPVDADLLPAVDPEYKPPFRFLPYGVRRCLTNREMTDFRRIARRLPPHFALGRSRQLQGLARAMVKLWERSAIAKIAIKRGVQNTHNERMAEELKVFTGGVLVSRNKEYIVLYRGNDFLPPAVLEILKERKKLSYLKQEEEEEARNMALASVVSSTRTSKGPLVAGTLAETVAATSRWRDHQNSQDTDEMMREAVLAKLALSIKQLQNKLGHAKGKLKVAEKALAKLYERTDPSELPTDLETISDEERFLFRKIGLSMKPYFFLGKRGVYGGTIENIHLHWKYRELVKVIAKRKSFAQIKHIAIDLEAESGGILVSIERTTKGYAIIIYRGKNYLRPQKMRPQNLLTKRQALARSVELQRREAMKHYISELQERIRLLTLEFEEMELGKKVNADRMSSILEYSSASDSEVEEEGAEAYLEDYDSSNENTNEEN
ncbi:CRM-domain containing factor CFM3, chloroplastic/mitochondrial [Mercurialis annua]|uniref:CRM-domain containing factor CFM3, chloroplastic/mitochondrial n=1 Tax=Mercurialis annua TaxID=3986 RepID=UPI0021600572|nr:CRM-domain containing factor CFM3, chloroplastic/mitochondrial [Mercurialis annua]